MRKQTHRVLSLLTLGMLFGGNIANNQKATIETNVSSNNKNSSTGPIYFQTRSQKIKSKRIKKHS
jgi:hypothetical protein